MKSLLIFAIIAITCSIPHEGERAFKTFVSKYQKTYSTQDEMAERKAIFLENYHKVMNLRSMDDSDAFADLGMSPFMDLTQEEFKGKYLNLKLGESMKPETCDYSLSGEGETLATELDWRKEGVVQDAKNQGACGSCWAFSAVSNIEARYKMVYGADKRFSEQMLVDCSEKDEGCNGGLMENAFNALKDMKLVEESEYKYTGRQGECRQEDIEGENIVKGCAFAETDDEDEIAKMLQKNGPLAVAVNASWLQFYFGGIHNPWFCSKDALNHGVAIVGFGEQKGKKYWIVKNSWGSSWGEKGYFRILRGKSVCGINQYVTSVVFNEDN